MHIDEPIFGRRSVRKYTAQAVDEVTIRRLIDAAVWAPSAINEQPWDFTVVRDQELLTRISRDAKAQMVAAMPADLGVGARADHFRTMLQDPSFQIFYHAPVLLMISASAPGPWIVEDCALAAENLMLMAHALGLASCWIGFAQRYLNTADGKRALRLPAACVPVAPIIVGYPGEVPAAVPRNAPRIRWVG